MLFLSNAFRQVALTMDPSHLVTPPRAHPSGSANGLDDHHQQRKQPQNLIHEPWFIVLISIVVLLFSFIATVGMIFFRRRHQSTKEIGHLNGMFPKKKKTLTHSLKFKRKNEKYII